MMLIFAEVKCRNVMPRQPKAPLLRKVSGAKGESEGGYQLMAFRPRSLSALFSWLQAKADNFLNCFGVPPLRKLAIFWPLRILRPASFPPGSEQYLFIF